MSNPFDQFAGTLTAALPPAPQADSASVAGGQSVAGQSQALTHPPQFSLMAQPTAEKKPVMNAPMAMQPQQGMMNGGMYGQQQLQQAPAPGGMYGGPPQQQGMMMMQPSNSVTSQGFGMAGSLTNGAPPQNGAMAGALVPSAQQSNPYALGPMAPPPPQQQLQQQPAAQGNALVNPFGMQPPQQQQQMQQANPFGSMTGQQQPPMMQQQQQQQQQALPPTQQQQALPPTQQQYGAPPQPPAPPQLAAAPFGAPPAAALPPAQSNALVPSAAPPSADPFGVFGAAPVGAGQSALGAPPVVQGGFPELQQQQQQGAPFGAGQSAVGAPPAVQGGFPDESPFGAGPPSVAPSMPSAAPVPQQHYQQAPPQPQQPAASDPWSDMGFGPPASSEPLGPTPGENDDLFNVGLAPTRAEAEAAAAETAQSKKPSAAKEPKVKRQKGELPPGGEWYDAKIFTPTLGVMFFKPKELTDSLFLQTDKKLVDALEDRPVVAFIVEGSSARSAGVELGHVLLKVNGIDVKNPKEASRLIKEGPRPLPLLFYVPDTKVVVAEGEHMVKYNTKETGAPNSAKDWKPKYVVIGGIIAQPWMMNMYRSKSEYDIAVIETQARRPVSVKVKQFSLQGARIQNDWQGPQMVKYKNKLHPWKYIVILPISRNPIKIASPNLGQLKPCHEGIRRVLNAQQRDRGRKNPHDATPVQRDPYSGGGYDTRNNRRGGY